MGSCPGVFKKNKKGNLPVKALFIHTDIHRFDPEDYGFNGMICWDNMQFGISYISSCLKEAGHKTALLYINRHSWKDALLACVKKEKPDTLCLGGVSTQFKHILKISRFARSEFPEIYQVYGGINATLAEFNPGDLPFDAICKGEGEEAMLELAGKIDKGENPRQIMNLTVKKNGRFISNPNRPFIQDLDQLPFPDRKMWERYVSPEVFNKHVLLLSRGCPFECTYCSNKALKRIAGGSYVRFRSPESIICELRHMRKQYPGLSEVYLETEMITANLYWLEELCEKLREFNLNPENRFSFGANMRIVPGTDNSRIFKMLKESGFEYVRIGIESGSKRVRRDILRRNYSNEDIISVFREAKTHGIKPDAYNMIGLPGERPEDFEETIKVNRIVQPEEPNLSIFFPYPGTDLFEVSREKGYLKKDTDLLEEREDPALDMNFFPAGMIKKYYARFKWDVYRGKKSAFLLLRSYIYRRYVINDKMLLRGYLFFRNLIVYPFRKIAACKELFFPKKGTQKQAKNKTKEKKDKNNDIPDTTYTLW